MSYSAPRGTKDVLPEDSPKWQYVEGVFMDACHKYGFEEIRTPGFEQTELFLRGVGDTTDIVQKEMYTFLDKSDRSMTLRPEATAGVVRAFIQHGMSSRSYPVRLCYHGPMYRYERVAKGRAREFTQLGVEAFGSASPEMDIEVISLAHHFMKNLGLQNIALHINSVGNVISRQAYDKALRTFLSPHTEELCEDCKIRKEKNPLRTLDCKVPSCQAILQNAPHLLDYLDDECKKDFKTVCKGLDHLGIPYYINPTLVRGLDYYTKTVFEFVSENVGTQGTIGAGGRYDTLVKNLGGPEVSGIGFSFGLERILLEMDAQKVTFSKMQAKRIFIVARDKELQAQAQALSLRLRQEDIYAYVDVCDRSFKAQLKYADKEGYDYLAVLGEEEVNKRNIQVKSMKNKDEVHQLSLEQLEEWKIFQTGNKTK